MNHPPPSSVPAWYWGAAGLALLWNLIGCAIFFSELFAQEAMIASMTEDQQAWARSTPGWIYAVFAVSVSTGVAGSICLLLRHRQAVALYVVSLVAVLVQMTYTMLIAGGLQVMGPSGAVMPVVVVSLAVVWLLFSVLAKHKAWLAK